MHNGAQNSLEAFDRQLSKKCGKLRPFGNALILRAEDFRETLPEMPRLSTVDEIGACLNYFTLVTHKDAKINYSCKTIDNLKYLRINCWKSGTGRC